jgi:hypothetical protein
MNTQKNVNQRLAKLYTQDTKQELSSEKVELATIAQVQKAAKAFDKVFIFDKAKAKYNSIIKQKSQIAKELNQFAKDFETVGAPNNLMIMVNDVIQQGKELGVDMTKNPDVKYAMMQWDAYKETQKELGKLSAEAIQEAKKLS